MSDNVHIYLFITFQIKVVKDILDHLHMPAAQRLAIRVKRFFGQTINSPILEYRGRNLIIERAPEPNDILWENIGYTTFFKFKRQLITGIATILVLLVCFALLFSIYYVQVYL